jgi:hypothetical protein
LLVDFASLSYEKVFLAYIFIVFFVKWRLPISANVNVRLFPWLINRLIIEASNTIPKTADLVKHFKDKYSYSTIDTILKNKDKILQAIENGAGGKRSIIIAVKHPKLEETLLT